MPEVVEALKRIQPSAALRHVKTPFPNYEPVERMLFVHRIFRKRDTQNVVLSNFIPIKKVVEKPSYCSLRDNCYLSTCLSAVYIHVIDDINDIGSTSTCINRSRKTISDA